MHYKSRRVATAGVVLTCVCVLYVSFWKDDYNKLEIPMEMFVNVPSTYPVCGTSGLLRPALQQNTRDWMIFFVKTSPSHYAKREVIRRTWAQVSSIRNKSFRTIFLVGKSNDDKTEKLRRKENDVHHDLLQCDFVDSYQNLPTKVLSAFRWVIDKDIQSTHYTFCDDDVVMHIANIIFYFTRIDEEKNRNDSINCGYYTASNLVPHRWKRNKWYVSKKMYNANMYPQYCLGPMWTLSRNMLKDIYDAAKRTDAGTFSIEDVFVTGILRYKVSPLNQIPVEAAQLDGGRRLMELVDYPAGVFWRENPNQFIKLMEQKWKKYNISLQKAYDTEIVTYFKIS